MDRLLLAHVSRPRSYEQMKKIFLTIAIFLLPSLAHAAESDIYSVVSPGLLNISALPSGYLVATYQGDNGNVENTTSFPCVDCFDMSDGYFPPAEGFYIVFDNTPFPLGEDPSFYMSDPVSWGVVEYGSWVLDSTMVLYEAPSAPEPPPWAPSTFASNPLIQLDFSAVLMYMMAPLIALVIYFFFKLFGFFKW